MVPDTFSRLRLPGSWSRLAPRNGSCHHLFDPTAPVAVFYFSKSGGSIEKRRGECRPRTRREITLISGVCLLVYVFGIVLRILYQELLCSGFPFERRCHT